MADVCADLVDQLQLEPTVRALVGTRVYGAAVPDNVDRPFVWLQRRGANESGAMEAEDEPWQELFDLECVADDAAAAAELAAAIRVAINGHSGQMGDGVYSWVAVTVAGDDYLPRNLSADEHLFISALGVEVTRP